MIQLNITNQLAQQDPTSLIPMQFTGVRKMNYADFERRINDLTKGFLIRGIQQNSTVLVLKNEQLEFIESFVALSKIEANIVTVSNIKALTKIINHFDVEAILLPYKEILRLFKKEDLIKQNREYLRFKNMPKLRNIFSFDPIKLRGAFTLQELMLLGKHIDDMELEEQIPMETENSWFSHRVSILNNGEIHHVKQTLSDISIKTFPFFDLNKV